MWRHRYVHIELLPKWNSFWNMQSLSFYIFDIENGCHIGFILKNSLGVKHRCRQIKQFPKWNSFFFLDIPIWWSRLPWCMMVNLDFRQTPQGIHWDFFGACIKVFRVTVQKDSIDTQISTSNPNFGRLLCQTSNISRAIGASCQYPIYSNTCKWVQCNIKLGT